MAVGLRECGAAHDRAAGLHRRRRPARPGLASWAAARPVLAARPSMCRTRPCCRRRRGCRRPSGAAPARSCGSRWPSPTRRSRRPALDPQTLADGVHVVGRRRHQLPRAVRDAGRRRPAALADALHQLGPQRGRRLLAHRGREPRRRRPACARTTAASAPACSRPRRRCAGAAQPVLLVACDVPYPEPLHAVRPLARRLRRRAAARAGRAQRRWQRSTIALVDADAAGAPSSCGDAALDALRTTHPGGRGAAAAAGARGRRRASAEPRPICRRCSCAPRCASVSPSA